MRREGLTVTMVFLAESANYGEGIGNISTLKKMSRGNHEQYSYISRQAMRYNIVRQANWDQTPFKRDTDFGIDEDSAWLNRSSCEYDWKIWEIPQKVSVDEIRQDSTLV